MGHGAGSVRYSNFPGRTDQGLASRGSSDQEEVDVEEPKGESNGEEMEIYDVPVSESYENWTYSKTMEQSRGQLETPLTQSRPL